MLTRATASLRRSDTTDNVAALVVTARSPVVILLYSTLAFTIFLKFQTSDYYNAGFLRFLGFKTLLFVLHRPPVEEWLLSVVYLFIDSF